MESVDTPGDDLTKRGARIRAVPVGLGIAEALANGDHVLALELLERELGEVVDGLVVNVVANDEEVVTGGRLGGDGLGDNVFGLLNLRGAVVQIVGGVEVEVDDGVAERLHVAFAAAGGGAGGVRGSFGEGKDEC